MRCNEVFEEIYFCFLFFASSSSSFSSLDECPQQATADVKMRNKINKKRAFVGFGCSVRDLETCLHGIYVYLGISFPSAYQQ